MTNATISGSKQTQQGQRAAAPGRCTWWALAMETDQATYNPDAAALAHWLGNDAADDWWTVDGDISLMEAIDFPLSG